MSTLLLLPVAWVPVPFGFRWSLPADSRSYEGLGGGIAWALDPAFCEQLLPWNRWRAEREQSSHVQA